MTIIDAVTGELCMWTIYDSPSDAPGKFVARLFVMDRPMQAALVCDTLDEVRELLARLYPDLVCLPRSPNDEPHIVECWL